MSLKAHFSAVKRQYLPSKFSEFSFQISEKRFRSSGALYLLVDTNMIGCAIHNFLRVVFDQARNDSMNCSVVVDVVEVMIEDNNCMLEEAISDGYVVTFSSQGQAEDSNVRGISSDVERQEIIDGTSKILRRNIQLVIHAHMSPNQNKLDTAEAEVFVEHHLRQFSIDQEKKSSQYMRSAGILKV